MATLPAPPAGVTGVKCSFQWSQQSEKSGGWTENFYNSAVSFTAAAPLVQNLIGKMLPTRTVWGYLNRVRVTLLGGGFRLAQIVKPTGGSVPGTYGSAGTIIQAKASIQLVNAAGKATRQWLGAVPSTCIFNDGTWVPTAAWTAAFNSFLTQLKTDGWQIRNLDQSQTKNTGITVAGAGVFTYPAHGLNTNYSIRMGRWPHGFHVNGIWRVNVIDANTFTLQGWTVPTVLPVPTKSTYWQYQYYLYTPIALNSTIPSSAPVNQVIRATKHDVGRPSLVYSGRRKTPGN